MEPTEYNDEPVVENNLHMLDTDGDVYTLNIAGEELEIRIADDPELGPDYAFKVRREDLSTLALWAISTIEQENLNGLFDVETDSLVGFIADNPKLKYIKSNVPTTEEEAAQLRLCVTADLASLATFDALKRDALHQAA